MFWEWAVDGFAAGVRIVFAALTVAGFTAVVVALIGLLSYAMQEGRDEIEKTMRD